MTTMIDGIAADVPAILARYGSGTPVAGYVTGGPPIEWSEAQFGLFVRKIRIAQSPWPILDEDSPARVLDVERGAAAPDTWPKFYESRASKPQATCYCSLMTVPAVVAACDAANVPLPPRWWLAWYWGRPGYPALSDVLTELFQLTGVQLPPLTVWAVQYASYAQWDTSQVFGLADFSRR